MTARKSGIDTAYLQESVGKVLATAIAATIEAQPADPVEHLALWLLHYLDRQQAEKAKLEQLHKLEQEREKWNFEYATKSAIAATTVQLAWRQHVRFAREKAAREQRLARRIEEHEALMEENDEFRTDNIVVETEEKSEHEVEKETEKLRAHIEFRKAQSLVSQLDKTSIADLKTRKKLPADAVSVMRCVFYLLDRKPRQVHNWESITAIIKPSVLLESVRSFDPVATGQRRRKFMRVRRILRPLQRDQVRRASIAIFLFYQWALAAVDYRRARDDENALLKELGRDVEEEEEEEDPEDEADQDPEEEAVRQLEEEERRRLDAEEAAARAQDQAEEDADAEADEED
eukprot:NODE_445_length_1476_cov_162.171689_g328_i0.p1 GENE.NODE_445_length_1476_cov_162.171689_g328_i0~~NODE_445_length_1476_cov_162.171689_g328_i0.p1  ORF type:complete len:346 (-),score=82.18 NODE_445_length_1476_cov_162.171689_g328_i0:377-1414(-)